MKPKTMDEYLAAVGPDKRAALERLRQTIRSVVPAAEEGISYGLAAFRLNKKPLVAFGATEKHCAFYLMSATTVEDHPKELKGYDTSKGTIRFGPDKPLPVALVRKLVKARVDENERLQKKAPAVIRSPTLNDIRGKTILVGITRLAHKGEIIGQQQFAGVFESMDASIQIRVSTTGKVFILPPDLGVFQKAELGIYRLRSTGETIENPDFTASWTVTAPAPVPKSGKKRKKM